VLLVDDDPLGLKLAALRLRGAGYTVDTANTAEAALVAARAEPPDAIVSDIRMPLMDGFQLCEAIRSEVRLARIPVLLLSGLVNEYEQQRAKGLGARCILRTADLRETIEVLSVMLGDNSTG
jgi:two-component system NtrC family sensor kinase